MVRCPPSGSTRAPPAAGIGRSGVFCVLDIVTRRLQRLEAGDAGGGAQVRQQAAGLARADAAG